MEKRSLTQQKHTFTNQKKCTTTQNKHKAKEIDIRPANGVGLFRFRHFKNLSHTYLLRHSHTYSPRPTHSDYYNCWTDKLLVVTFFYVCHTLWTYSCAPFFCILCLLLVLHNVTFRTPHFQILIPCGDTYQSLTLLAFVGINSGRGTKAEHLQRCLLWQSFVWLHKQVVTVVNKLSALP